MFGHWKRLRSDGTSVLTTGKLCLTHLSRGRTLAVIFTVLVAGCGPPKLAPVPPKTMVEFTCRTSSEGLEIAVDAWTDRDRVKKHFGMDLLSRQIVPFEIAFANVGAEGGFLLQPELVVILDDRGLQEIRSASGWIVPSGLDPTVGIATYLAISQAFAIGLIIVAEEGYQDEQDIRRQMNSMQFIDRPLYRSDSNKGFLYLKFGDIANLPKVAAVKFRVKNVRSRQEKTLIVTLKGR